MGRLQAALDVITRTIGKPSELCLLSQVITPLNPYQDECLVLARVQNKDHVVAFTLSWSCCRLWVAGCRVTGSSSVSVSKQSLLDEFGLHQSFTQIADITCDPWYRTGHADLVIQVQQSKWRWCWRYLPHPGGNKKVHQFGSQLSEVVASRLSQESGDEAAGS